MKPMLAYNKAVDLAKLKYPLYSSPKLDGIRCIIKDGVPVSRNLKFIPNLHVQALLSRIELEGFDGELMINGDFNAVQSAIMSIQGKPDFSYHVFDIVPAQGTFEQRQQLLYKRWHQLPEDLQAIVKVVPQTPVHCGADVTYHDVNYLAAGHEGSILRDPHAQYKFGRSTLREQGMIKIVQWHRAEAIVVSVEELMRNENEAETNELGYQTRSHALAGQVPGGTLGALCCEMLVSSGTRTEPVLFSIGTGFDAEQRDNLWRNPPIGRIVTFKYKELSKYGVPRHPVFVGFRSAEDMS